MPTLTPDQIDSTFNVQRTVEKETVGGVVQDVVTALEVQTSLPLILTQDSKKAGQPNYLYLPESASLQIFGDEITVSGKLSFPGRNVVIFARVLLGQSDGTNPPTISVDGPPLPEEKAKPKPLPKGTEVSGQVPKGKVAVGAKGDDGYNNHDAFAHLIEWTALPGLTGWSGPDHPNEMNGEPGNPGAKGNKAGNVWIYCGKTDFGGPDQKLTITAVGGLGGEGQPGQEGAEGGPGGKGFDMEILPPFNILKYPTMGGNGGNGGNGGKGGRGGQGGDGGTITVHCISAAPAVTVKYGGGTGGVPGARGKYGEAGKPGPGGKGVELPGKGKFPDAYDGQPGSIGSWGDLGDTAPPSKDGTSALTTGEVEPSSLAKLASVTQLQMLLERIRAEYLVTEPSDYSLRLMAVATPEDLVDSGRNLVVVAMVGHNLHIRIFDATGEQVVDKTEGELAAGDALTALKQQFSMTMADVLLAGGWRSAKQLEDMSAADQRQTLIDQLTQISNQPASYYSPLSDYTLIGDGAVLAFLLKQGVRDEGSLKTYSDDDKRNTLIVGIAQHIAKAENLQSMDNQQLVRLALEQCSGNSYSSVLQDSLVSLRNRLSNPPQDRENILKNVQAVSGYSDAWGKIGEQLFWLFKLLQAAATDDPKNDASNENSQKALAKTLSPSVWTLINNYRNGLDYYGKTPRYVPSLSLNSYLSDFEASRARFQRIEGYRDGYFNALKQQQNTTSDLNSALTSVKEQLGALNTRKGDLTSKLTTIEDSINTIDAERKNLEPALETALKAFQTEVTTAFGLSLNTFFSCLSTLSFTNVSEPARATETLGKVAGYANAGAMVGSQVGTMIKEGVDNVLNDSGEPINKKLILSQIEVAQKDVDLKSQFTKLGDGFFSNDASNRLLVELDQFRELCRQFNNLHQSPELRKQLDKYIEVITSRNRNIDYYNFLVQQILDLAGEAKKLTLQQDSVNGNLSLAAAQPGLPMMATFVSGLYEQAKAICVSDLYHAYRAYAFWALEPYSGFYDLIGRSPGAITAEQLEAAAGNITDDIKNNLESSRDTPNIFPAGTDSGSPGSESTMGYPVVLTKEKYPDLFDDLQFDGWAEFELEPATKASKAPSSLFAPTEAAWYGSTRPQLSPSHVNPFHGMADVRITKVRVWMVGMTTTTDYHNVTLIYLGQSQFRTRKNLPYPERRSPTAETDQDKRDPEYVIQEPVSIRFNYKAEGLNYDPQKEKDPFTPGRLFGNNLAGTEDGNLSYAGTGDAKLPSQKEYAVIGPFGKWRLEVLREENNPGLDLSKLTMIVIDFHGFHRTFSS